MEPPEPLAGAFADDGQRDVLSSLDSLFTPPPDFSQRLTIIVVATGIRPRREGALHELQPCQRLGHVRSLSRRGR